MEAGPSKTAMAAAIVRGHHRLYDEPPWVLDDPFALMLVGPVWRVMERRFAKRYPEAVARGWRAGIVGRSRYTEDRLVEGFFDQYVILGAGLDSFAWRRPDLTRALGVFEVDHPASQEWKRERASNLALPATPPVVYVPVDFEVQALPDGLAAAHFEWEKPTFFSWMGVTMYLTQAAIAATLRVVARCAPGSEIVFTYAPTDEHLDDLGRQFDRISDALVAEIGEPVQARFSRTEVETLVRGCGLEVIDHPDHANLVKQYFLSRPDGLRPYTCEGIIAAYVPGR